MRYVLEGEWSGYHSGQRHVVHRTVITPEKAEQIREQNLFAIYYTDGTSLDLSVREAGSHERVTENHGYDSLIEKCIRYKCNSVAKLPHNEL